jgi:hypothetical protein
MNLSRLLPPRVIRLLALASVLTGPAFAAGSLSYDEAGGVVWENAHATVRVDGMETARGPQFIFGKTGTPCGMREVSVLEKGADSLTLEGQVPLPEGGSLTVRRILKTTTSSGGEALTERFEIRGGEAVKTDLEVVRPFSIAGKAGALSCALPRKDGYFETKAVATGAAVAGEYRLGEWVGDEIKQGESRQGGLSYDGAKTVAGKTPELALPVMAFRRAGAWQGAVCADPYFSAMFTMTDRKDGVTAGESRHRYWSSKIALEPVESRTFGFWLGNESSAEPKLRAPVDAFFTLMLPDVAPGPRWVSELYGSYYDIMYQKGESWKKDMDAMAKRLGLENTKHIAVCYHGWYDFLGRYCFDTKTGKIDDAWDCVPLKELRFKMTKAKMREDLAHAKKLGFRTLIYFGDGLADCSGAPGYRADWNWTSLRGKKPGDRLTCWSPPKVMDGPRCFGRNPAHPEVIAWHHAYMKALLEDFGDVIDGFTWDETFHIGTGYAAAKPVPSYSDRALMRLVRDLTKQVEAHDPKMVFLSSDAIGLGGCWGQSYPNGIPGYAMVADGNFQDTGCGFSKWSGCMFPNWRNNYWSCNWFPVSRFEEMATGSLLMGTPVSWSTAGGYGCSRDPRDVTSPHEWDDAVWEKWVTLFRRRLADGPKHVRYKTAPDFIKMTRANTPEEFKTERDAKSQSW